MKTMARTWFTVSVLMAALLSLQILSACGNNSGGGSPAAPPPPPPPPGVGPISSCQVGQIYNPTYGCLAQYTCNYGYGWAPTVNQCVQGQVVTINDVTNGQYGTLIQFAGDLTINNQDTYFKFLKYMGICDFAWVGPFPTDTGAINFGAAACANYTAGSYITIYANSSPAITTAWVQITATGSGWWGSNSIRTSQSMQVTPYNNNTQIQLTGLAYSGAQTGLRLFLNTPNFNAPYFGLTARYGNVDFATSSVQRY